MRDGYTDITCKPITCVRRCIALWESVIWGHRFWIWKSTHWAGSLHSGSLQFGILQGSSHQCCVLRSTHQGVYTLGIYRGRATDDGSGHPLSRDCLHSGSTLWESAVWESTGLGPPILDVTNHSCFGNLQASLHSGTLHSGSPHSGGLHSWGLQPRTTNHGCRHAFIWDW